MRLIIFPNSIASIDKLTEISESLALPSPICWGQPDLERTIRELIQGGAGDSGLLPDPQQITAAVEATGIPDPVIIFYRIGSEQITQVIKEYKSRNEWPIMAVVTKQSLDMTLAIMIQHLLDDRSDEAAIRANASGS